MPALHSQDVPALVADILADPDRVRLVLIIQEEPDGSRVGQGLSHPHLSARDLDLAELNLARARERLAAFSRHAS